MNRYTGPVWLRGAFILSVILIGTSIGASLQTALAQTITVPRRVVVPYSLEAGAISAPINVVPEKPVLVMGVSTTVGFRGVGQVSLLSSPAGDAILGWVGLESTAGAVITQGFSAVEGTHIVFLDFSHQVDIEVATPTSIRVHNTSSGVRTGRVTLIW